MPQKSKKTNKSFVLAEDAASAFIELLVFAAKNGVDLKINHAYRSHKEQAALKKKMTKKGKGHLVAEPGRSTHESGRSIDVRGCLVFVSDEKLSSKPELLSKVKKWTKQEACSKTSKGYECKTGLYWWLKKHAKKYGFVNDVSNEPWHWTFYKVREE